MSVVITQGALAPGRAREGIPFEFRATGSEYFRIWIVNLLLTLVTLGVYSPWAKVRRLRPTTVRCNLLTGRLLQINIGGHL
jgi:uncharacterized membrane protein YjgN (DUF898 family)